MRDDLLPAQAAIEWAKAQIGVFTSRFSDWRNKRPYIGVTEQDGNTGHDIIKARLVGEPLPLIISAEAGAIINMFRSSLDILVVTLAKRKGYARTKVLSFPFAAMEETFWRGKDPAVKKIKGLSDADRTAITGLKPYQGGDNILFSLNKLDNIRKHQQLLTVTLIPTPVSGLYRPGSNNAPAESLFQGRLEDGVPLWRIPHNLEAEANLSPDISFTEAVMPDKRARNALLAFAKRTEEIIALFG